VTALTVQHASVGEGSARGFLRVRYLALVSSATAGTMGSSSQSQQDAPSDAGLLDAIARERSQPAFQELFLRYAPRLKAHYMRSGQGEAQAEDLAQDVMLSVWHHADSYRPDMAAASTWIFRIARNRFIDVVRRQRYVELEPHVLDAQDMGRQGLDDDLATQQLGARVTAALSELSAEQAEVIRGSYFSHESASQIAARLKIPTGTVKSRLRAGLAHLQERIFVSAKPEARPRANDPSKGEGR
jgi:RNA polymerase sigma factor (sigma-70 family)